MVQVRENFRFSDCAPRLKVKCYSVPVWVDIQMLDIQL